MKIKDLILKTEKVNWQNLKDLQPIDLKNNYHSEKTKKSIIENGFARAIYVWQEQDNIYIIDGHLRTDILIELKNEGFEIPDQLNCTFLDLPNKKTAIKYLLQVFNQKTNPINSNNLDNWLQEVDLNIEELNIELEELHIELSEIEVEAEEEQEEVKEDEVPEVKHNFVVKGDLFELIDEEQGLTHRVLCGDSTMIDDVDKVMNGEKADMVFTDPPYGMSLNTNYNYYKINNSKKAKENNLLIGKYEPIINDDKEFDASFLINYFKYCKEQFWFGADYYRETIEKSGSWIVWDKTGGHDSLMNAGFGSNFELCWSRCSHKRDIARITRKGIAGHNDGKRVHPTMKPIALNRWFFKKWGKENDLVADLYLGSGSTLIACQQTKRNCYGIELDEHYCGVVITRWKNYMEKEGKKYSIKRNGEEFNLKT